MNRRLLPIGISVSALAGLFAGSLLASASQPGLQGDDADGAYSRVVEAMGEWEWSGDAVWLTETLREALPNVRFSIDGGPDSTAYDAVYEGRVVNVREGVGYITESGRGTSKVVDFGDSQAEWQTVELTLDVESDFDSSAGDVETVDFVAVLGFGLDLETMKIGLEGRRVLVVLDDSAVSHDPTLMGVARGADCLAWWARMDLFRCRYWGTRRFPIWMVLRRWTRFWPLPRNRPRRSRSHWTAASHE